MGETEGMRKRRAMEDEERMRERGTDCFGLRPRNDDVFLLAYANFIDNTVILMITVLSCQVNF